MSLIEVLTDDGNQIAKIVDEKGDGGITIRYLVSYKKSDTLFRFEKKTYEIERENISGFYDTDDLTELGYTLIDKNLYEFDEGSDYHPSSEESDDDVDEDCVDSEEEYMSDEC